MSNWKRAAIVAAALAVQVVGLASLAWGEYAAGQRAAERRRVMAEKGIAPICVQTVRVPVREGK